MTSLSRQLKQLATPQSSLLDHKRKRASLLFSASEAANYSRETFFNIGYSGFAELTEINSQFSQFKEALFDKRIIEFQRTIQTKEVNNRLDKSITEFLLILSPYLQKAASLKALEWLIYRFLINEMNVEALMMCIIPYYESVIFTRILQLIDISSEKSPWNWLYKTQLNGVTVPKQTVFLHWSSNVWFRNFVSNYFIKVLKLYKRENLKIAVSFFISTQIGGTVTSEKGTEGHIASIFQTFDKTFLSNNEELISGMMLLIGHLVVKRQFASNFTEQVLLKLSKITESKLRENCAICLLTVCHYQNIEEFSVPVLKLLDSNKGLLKIIVRLANEKAVGCFILPYVCGMLKLFLTCDDGSLRSTLTKEKVMSLVNLIQTLPLTPSESCKIISKFMDCLTAHSKLLENMKEPLDLSLVWQELEKSHPEGADKADFTDIDLMVKKEGYQMEIDSKNDYEQTTTEKSKHLQEVEIWVKDYNAICNVSKPMLLACRKFIKHKVIFNEESMCNQAFWDLALIEDDKFIHSLKLVIHILSVVVSLQMQNLHTDICNSILEIIFKKKLKNLKHQLRFLALIWSWHTDSAVDLTVDVKLKLWALNLSSALISSSNSSSSLSWILAPEESLVLSLLPAFCDEGFLCKASFLVLKEIQSVVGGRLRENSFSVLVEMLLQHEEEISVDASFLPTVAAVLLKGKKSAGWKVVNYLTDNILSDSIPPHLKCSILYLLSQIESPEILERLIPTGITLLEKIQSLGYDEKLDPLSSTLLYYIILRFPLNDAAILSQEGGRKMFNRVMELTEPVLQVTGKILSPQELVLNCKFLQGISNSDKQLDILDALLNRAIVAETPLEAMRLRRELKKTSIETSTIASLLSRYNTQTKLTSVKEVRAKKFKMHRENIAEGSISSTESLNWQKLGLVVELTGVMSDIKEPWTLINPLCHHLKLTLEHETSFADVLQQQILSILYHLLQSSTKILTKSDFVQHINESIVVLSVHCIRQSVNPDIHRRALLILALVASFYPEKVLHNIMAIFTFMGTSLLKRDDSYSFQVIHQTVSSIVPVLLQTQTSKLSSLVQLAQVTQVFVDALPDLAEHRKLPLFKQLAETLGVSQYLWLVLAQLADAFVTHNANISIESSKVSAARGLHPDIQFALVLYSQFSVVNQLRASYEVLNFACSLPDDKDVFKNMKQKERTSSTQIINIESYTSKQLRQLKHSCIGLLQHLLSSDRFVGQVYELHRTEEAADMKQLQNLFEHLLEQTLNYIKTASTNEEINKGKPAGRFWHDMQRKLLDLVQAINSLLPPSSFVVVISNLLSSKASVIRGRAMEILASRLLPETHYFSENEVEALCQVLVLLQNIGSSSTELEENRQIALYALQLLVKFLGSHIDPELLLPVLETSSKLVTQKDIPLKLETQAILVVAECSSILKVHCLPYLQQVVPALLNTLDAATQETILETHTVAAATALQKVVENVPQFVSQPQLENLVKINCRLLSDLEELGQNESRLYARLSSILELVIHKIDARSVIQILFKVYSHTFTHTLFALPTLMRMTETFINSIPSVQLVVFKQDLVHLFTSALDVRSLKEKSSIIERAEESVISALTRFLLRLNEDDNITVFSGFINWAWRDQEEHPGRLSTFFRFADNLAGKLKVLFIKAKLANSILVYAAKTLDRNNSIHHKDNTFGKGLQSEEKACELLNYVLDTLTKIFTYDTVHFTTAEQFNIIVTSLMDQLENTLGEDEHFLARISNHLEPCVVKLASVVGDDSLWKELNRQLLMRVKVDDSPKIILATLQIFERLIESLGEDYLQPLIADTMPHITEVLESLDPDIESKTKEIFKKMEAILGDNLRAYLDT